MTSLWKWARACALAAPIVLYATLALAQSPAEGDQHKEHHSAASKASGGDQATKPMCHEMMARIAALDARIETMVADMNMFTGELKTAAIASLLTAIVERDKALREIMMQMHQQMMQKMMAAPVEAAGGEETPGMMCGPMMK